VPNEYAVSVTRSAVRLERHWTPSENEWDRPAWGGGGTAAGKAGASTAGRVVRDWSVRSRNNMRWQFSGLAWEELGRRPAMVTLTYPREWRAWAPCGRTVRRHLEAFKERWRRRWGTPIRGVWVREFQERGAPHVHLYVGLPDAVSDEEYRSLVGRTMRRRRLTEKVGKYEARRRAGSVQSEGAFAQWLLAAWSGCVGSGDALHARFGADVAPFFWGATATEAAAGNVNWGRVAEYLWHESGKWGQKQVPEDFGSPGRSWGKWGVRVVVGQGELDRATAMELRRALWGLWRSRSTEKPRPRKPRGRDGLTVYGVDPETAHRLLSWAEGTAAAKRLER
jgi:hypothetical protein